MLLVKPTINGTLYRISNEKLKLEHWWDAHIMSAPSMKLKMEYEHGGMVRPSFTDMVWSPDAYKDEWPPPSSSPVVIQHTDSTEAAAVTLFEGAVAIDDTTWYDRSQIPVKLRKPSDDIIVADGQAFNATLAAVFAWFCDATRLNLTLDTTAARAVSPAVLHTTSGDRNCYDLASEMAAFFGHAFVVRDGTLYLIDLLTPGTAVHLTEHDFFPAAYAGGKLISLVSCGANQVAGSSAGGDEYTVSTAYHTTSANIDAALAALVTILELQRARAPVPIRSGMPRIMDVIETYDESLVGDITTSGMRIVEAVYNWNDDDPGMTALAIGSLS